MINNDNYILWFIDYADEKLNEIEKGQLRHFLMENPALQNEFLDFLDANQYTLQKDDSFAAMDFSTLKKSESAEVDHTQRVDIRTLFEYTEGNLNFEDTLSVEEFMQTDAVLARNAQELELSKLDAEPVVYPHKNKLKKRVAPVFLWTTTLRYGSMAAGFALVFWLGYQFNRESSHSLPMAQQQIGSEQAKILLAMAEEWGRNAAIEEIEQSKQLAQNETTQKIIYIPIEKKTEPEIADYNNPETQKFYIPLPETQSNAPLILNSAPTIAMHTPSISNPQLDPGKFTPIKPEQNISPFEFELANSGRKKTGLVDVLSTIITLGGVLDKKDTRMVTGKSDEKGNKKVHFYSKAFEAEIAVKE